MARSPLLLALPLLVAGAASAAQAADAPAADVPLFASLPIRDLVGAPSAALRVQRALEDALGERGVRLVPATDLEEVLFARRIRDTASVSREDARAIGDATGAGWLLALALLDHAEGPTPRVSLAVRTVDLDQGERVQSALVTLTGADTRGLLGLGEVREAVALEERAIEEVLAHFDEVGRPLRRWRGHGALSAKRPASSLGSFRAAEFAPADVERVVVMPLVNGTAEPAAGLLTAEILGHELFALGGVQVVETAELRAALIRARVRAIRLMDRALFARVAADLGATHFLLGRLDAYARGAAGGRGSPPTVEASIRLLDARTGRIVAAAALRRSGDDHQRLLGLGRVRDVLKLADHTARELVALLLG